MKKIVYFLIFLSLIVTDNVYSQQELKIVTGKVYDLKTKKDLAGVKAILYDKDRKTVAESPVNSQGIYFFELLDMDNTYGVKVEAVGYTRAEVGVKFSSGNPTSRINFGLNPIEKGSDLSNVLNLDPIYFDFNSSYLNENNIRELRKIVDLLKAHPTMRIEVRAHADSRGSFVYNKWLTERRANRVANWIINEGKISVSRVVVRDYGKEQPIHVCKSTNSCSEAIHGENRRCEFIVL